MPKNHYCPPEYHDGIPHHDYCRSPTACDALGYCRRRNIDGTLQPTKNTEGGPDGHKHKDER